MIGGSHRLRAQTLLFLLLALVLLGHLRTVSLDRSVRDGTDSYIGPSLGIYFALGDPGLTASEKLRVLWHGKEGPVVPLFALVMLLLAGAPPASLRLLSVVAHLVLMVQCYDLGQLQGRALGRSPGRSDAGGLWAALLCGTCPLLFGLCRLSFCDAVAAVMLLAVMQIMARADLERPAVALGALVGLGMLTKLSFAVNLVGPLAWFMLRWVRSRRQLYRLSPVLLLPAVLVLPWALVSSDLLLRFVGGMALETAAIPVWDKLRYYLSLPGVVPLLACYVVALPLLWRRFPSARWDLGLMLTVVPMLAGLAIPPAWGRFLLPIVPLLGVVTGTGLACLQHQLPAPARRVMAAAGSVLLLSLYVTVSLGGLRLGETVAGRGERAGMLWPDRRASTCYPRALRALAAAGLPVLLSSDSEAGAAGVRLTETAVWKYYGFDARWIDLPEAHRRLAAGEPIGGLLHRAFGDEPLVSGLAPAAPTSRTRQRSGSPLAPDGSCSPVRTPTACGWWRSGSTPERPRQDRSSCLACCHKTSISSRSLSASVRPRRVSSVSTWAKRRANRRFVPRSASSGSISSLRAQLTRANSRSPSSRSMAWRLPPSAASSSSRSSSATFSRTAATSGQSKPTLAALLDSRWARGRAGMARGTPSSSPCGLPRSCCLICSQFTSTSCASRTRTSPKTWG